MKPLNLALLLFALSKAQTLTDKDAALFRSAAAPPRDRLLPDMLTPEDLEDRKNTGNRVPTTLENFPSPFSRPRRCNRPNNKSSYICDPDHLLSQPELNRIEQILFQGRKASSHQCGNLGFVSLNLAVALIQQLPQNVALDILAAELLDRWGVGHRECHDGTILMFSAQNNEFVLKWKIGVDPYLNYSAAKYIQRHCKNVAQKKTLSHAIEECVQLVVDHLNGEVLSPRQTPQLAFLLIITALFGLFYAACVVTVIASTFPTENKSQ